MRVALKTITLTFFAGWLMICTSCNRKMQIDTANKNYPATVENYTISASSNARQGVVDISEVSASASGQEMFESAKLEYYSSPILPDKITPEKRSPGKELAKEKAQLLKKEIKKEILRVNKQSKAQYAPFSKGTGIALIVGGLVLIVLGIAFLTQLGVLLGSIIAGVGVIVFLLGFLGLVL